MAGAGTAIELVHEERGEGMPVVLLHGFPMDHTIWRAQQAALSDRYRIITPDLRGHGASPAPDGDYTMDLLAGDVLALLDRLGIRRAVWAGHSMGGYVVMAALRLAPDRVAGAGFVATHHLADTDERRIMRRETAELALKNGSADVAFSMMGQIFAPSVDGTSPLAQSIYEVMVATPPPGVAGALRGMALRPDSTETLRALRVPALVIAGAEDKIVDLSVAREMAGLIPHASLVVIEHAGHMPMVEQPDQTTEALATWLASIDPDTV